jgi:preprotein translocase subunit SecD
LTESGRRRFAELTERVAGNRVALALDGVVCSAPTVQGTIPGGEFNISGPRPDGHRVQVAVMQRVLPEGVHCMPAPAL